MSSPEQVVPNNTVSSKTDTNETRNFFRNSQSSVPAIPLPPTPIKTLNDLQLTDDFEPGEFDWLVEDIFDKGRLHMIAGPQGSGKTRFFLRMINDWSKGLPVLGHPTNPAKFVYIDAARDKKSIKVALRSLGINPSDFFIIDWNAIHTSTSFTDLLKLIPFDVDVIFIDNLALMLSSDNTGEPSSSSSIVYKFLAKLKQWLNKNSKTIIFTHTFVKTETSHKYASPRGKVYGAQTWLQSSETTILFDEENPQDLRDPYRLIDIIVKNYQPKDHPRRFKLQDDGRVVHAPKLPNQIDKTLTKNEDHIDLLSYFPLDKDKKITAFELKKLTNLPESSLYRYLKKLQELNLIVKSEKQYSRV